MRFLALATTVSVLALCGSAMAESDADCTVRWNKIDTAKAGVVDGDIAKPYLAAMDTMKMSAAGAKEGKLTSKEFLFNH